MTGAKERSDCPKGASGMLEDVGMEYDGEVRQAVIPARHMPGIEAEFLLTLGFTSFLRIVGLGGSYHRARGTTKPS